MLEFLPAGNGSISSFPPSSGPGGALTPSHHARIPTSCSSEFRGAFPVLHLPQARRCRPGGDTRAAAPMEPSGLAGSRGARTGRGLRGPWHSALTTSLHGFCLNSCCPTASSSGSKGQRQRPPGTPAAGHGTRRSSVLRAREPGSAAGSSAPSTPRYPQVLSATPGKHS